MIGIDFKSNVKAFTKDMKAVERKQVPFATARALTWTAQDAQKDIQGKIKSIFNVTRKWWLKQQATGIKIKPAKKDNLKSSVYTDAYFAELQEEGGTRKPHKSGKLTIPTKKVPKSRRKAGGAKQMLQSDKVFATERGIYRRKGGKKRKNQKRELLYHKAASAKVSPRFGFMRMAEKVAKTKFSSNFWKSFKKAIKTAR